MIGQGDLGTGVSSALLVFGSASRRSVFRAFVCFFVFYFISFSCFQTITCEVVGFLFIGEAEEILFFFILTSSQSKSVQHVQF